MMTLTQFYLTKIAEEASEIAQIALKAQQFGLSEVQPGRDQSNAQRMYGELNDLFAMVHRLGEVSNGEFFFDIGAPDHVAIAKKLGKVEKYLEYSRSLGLVEPAEGVMTDAEGAARYRAVRDPADSKDGTLFVSEFQHPAGTIPRQRVVTGRELDRLADAAVAAAKGSDRA